mmetsp:Transcript_2949/g.3369  ORF Transcript_2949/g.3369 Transcript_2949/m.3369 type:complete len:211 (-) Transcript_2949:783-1415(-)|eukprot:CAMPEP_0184056356 /NCGR_PEP_ID=MMETSP0956-20121227/7721_1 /TAXON_ID=627963 /ORGANISM="Aplanochytrium sp, Strain PBS07" /LENGTH=210 /DNA_ID=CAMNT_0026350351 /DNA_START=148 /DNA_END=780 /DNA_ORIENTATION=+
MTSAFSSLSLGGNPTGPTQCLGSQFQSPVVNNVCGVLCPGRPVVVDWHQIESTKLICDIPDPGQVSDLSFFLLPGATIPQDSAMALYSSIPPFELWNLVGFVDVNSPSATFSTGWQSNSDYVQSNVVRLGASIEPADVIQNLQQSKSIRDNQARLDWGLKVAQDLHNFIGSYTTGPADQLILPANILDRWLTRFKEKYKRDPNFVLRNRG